MGTLTVPIRDPGERAAYVREWQEHRRRLGLDGYAAVQLPRPVARRQDVGLVGSGEQEMSDICPKSAD